MQIILDIKIIIVPLYRRKGLRPQPGRFPNDKSYDNN